MPRDEHRPRLRARCGAVAPPRRPADIRIRVELALRDVDAGRRHRCVDAERLHRHANRRARIRLSDTLRHAALAASCVDGWGGECGLRHEGALRLGLGNVRRLQDPLAVRVEANLRQPHARRAQLAVTLCVRNALPVRRPRAADLGTRAEWAEQLDADPHRRLAQAADAYPVVEGRSTPDDVIRDDGRHDGRGSSESRLGHVRALGDLGVVREAAGDRLAVRVVADPVDLDGRRRRTCRRLARRTSLASTACRCR